MMINIKKIMADYEPKGLWSDDGEFMDRLKEVIWNLPEIDKRVILLYTDLQSYRQVGKYLGVSSTTAFNLIKKIKERILEQL